MATFGTAPEPVPACRGHVVLEVQPLHDRFAAALKDDRSQPEWPPHPSRLYSALVAALHRMDGDEPAFAAAEAALRWLERLDAPEIHAARWEPAPLLSRYVPTNGQTVVGDGKSRGLEACLPGSPRRNRVREDPCAVLEIPVVRYAWRVDPEEMDRHRTALHELIARLWYFGRSVNFAAFRLLEVDPARLPFAERLDHLVPSEIGNHRLRVATPGRLDRLRELHDAGRAPDAGPYLFYALAGEAFAAGEAGSPWSGIWTVFSLARCRAAAADTEPVSKAIRAALVRRACDAAHPDGGVYPVDAFVSGHETDGTPTRIERLAIVPLPNVGNNNADGHLLGFAVVMPSCATADQWRTVSEIVFGSEEKGIPELSEVRYGPLVLTVGRGDPAGRQGMSQRRYTGASMTWTTVTPILLSRRPDSGRKRPSDEVLAARVRTQVALDCIACGLPEPAEVRVSPYSELTGVPSARAFLHREGGPPKWATHATITFDRPVRGPVLVGAGRYNGLGLMIPHAVMPSPETALGEDAS